jgi:methionyl-tRNA formyltransferase
MTAEPTFVYLGASGYALRILGEILARGGSRLLCLIDAGIDDARRRAIARELSDRVRVEDIHDTAVLRDPVFLAGLRDQRPDFALSAHFSEILSEDVFQIPRHGVANLHSAYLPYNRGHWPEVWSILRGTPAGITLHYIGRGIDTGDIIDQVRVAVAPEDTADSLAKRIELAGIDLVLRRWDALVRGEVTASPQAQRFPINLHQHLEQISEIDLDRAYTGRQLIDLLRALTIPRLLAGAFFVDRETGDRIHLQISLRREPSVPRAVHVTHREATNP